MSTTSALEKGVSGAVSVVVAVPFAPTSETDDPLWPICRVTPVAAFGLLSE